MAKTFTRFLKNESGATAIEYGLIAALMSVALIASFPLITSALEGAFGDIGDSMAVTP